MDHATAHFYDRYARETAPRTEAATSAMSRRFDDAFPPGGRILDVGAGSGRDLAVLIARGWDAFGVEPNASMRALAIAKHPALAERLADAALPALGRPFGGAFDGIVCSAVLMHLPGATLRPTLVTLRALLRPRGRLLLSIPRVPAAQLSGERDADGRVFHNHDPAAVRALARDAGFEGVEQWRQVHDGTTWHTLLFERDDG